MNTTQAVKFRFDEEADELVLTQDCMPTGALGFLKDHVNKVCKGFYALPPRIQSARKTEDTLVRTFPIRAPMSSFYYLRSILSEGYDIETQLSDFPYYNADLTDDALKDELMTLFKGASITPYPHQVECTIALFKHMRGIGEIPTSGGKTLIAFMTAYLVYKHAINRHLAYVVPTRSLFEQVASDWVEYAEKVVNPDIPRTSLPSIITLDTLKKKDSEYYNSKLDDGCTTILGTRKSWSNLCSENPQFVNNNFDGIIFDEVHMANNDESTAILDAFTKCPFRVGMTATVPTCEFSDGVKLRWNWGSPVYTAKVSDMIDMNQCSDVDIVQIHNKTIKSTSSSALANTASYLRRVRKFSEMLRVEQAFIESQTNRPSFIFKIINMITSGPRFHDGDNILIVFEHIETGHSIYDHLCEVSGRDCYYIDGKTTSAEREYVRNEVNKGSNCILVGSRRCIGTGFSIPNLQYAILVEGWSSPITSIQVIGRLMRKHVSKENRKAVLVDIVDELYPDCYMIRQGNARAKTLQEEFGNICHVRAVNTDEGEIVFKAHRK